MRLEVIQIEAASAEPGKLPGELLSALRSLAWAAHRRALDGDPSWPDGAHYEIWLSLIAPHERGSAEQELDYLLDGS